MTKMTAIFLLAVLLLAFGGPAALAASEFTIESLLQPEQPAQANPAPATPPPLAPAPTAAVEATTAPLPVPELPADGGMAPAPAPAVTAPAASAPVAHDLPEKRLAEDSQPITVADLAARMLGALQADIDKAGMKTIALAPVYTYWERSVLVYALEGAFWQHIDERGYKIVWPLKVHGEMAKRGLKLAESPDTAAMGEVARAFDADGMILWRVAERNETVSVFLKLINANGDVLAIAEIVNESKPAIDLPAGKPEVRKPAVAEPNVNQEPQLAKRTKLDDVIRKGSGTFVARDRIILRDNTSYEGMILSDDGARIIMRTENELVTVGRKDVMVMSHRR